jgi:hypothetical protein
MTVQSVTRDAARAIARPAAELARLEGLEAHARAADARLLPPLPFRGGDRGVGEVMEGEDRGELVTTGPTPTRLGASPVPRTGPKGPKPLKGRGL